MNESEFDAALFRGPQSLAATLGWGIERRLPPLTGEQLPRDVPAEELPAGLGESLVGSTVCDIVLEGEPTTKDRPRVGRGGNVYTPAPTRIAEEAVRWNLRASSVRADSDHWLRVEAGFFCGSPARKDIDNLCKLLLDACNGQAWRDDQQVFELDARLERQSDRPRTELRVIRLGRLTKDCERCGKLLGPGAKRFCSRSCYDIVQRVGEFVACPTCGAHVYRQRTEESLLKFCRASCAWEWKRTHRGTKAEAFPTLTLWRERTVFAELGQDGIALAAQDREVLTGLARAGAEVYLWRPSDRDEIDQVLGRRWKFDALLPGLYTGLAVADGGRVMLPSSLWLPRGSRVDGRT